MLFLLAKAHDTLDPRRALNGDHPGDDIMIRDCIGIPGSPFVGRVHLGSIYPIVPLVPRSWDI